MQAITVTPGQSGSAALSEVEQAPGTGDLRVRMLAVGVCGTDREILDGHYGKAPPGARRLVIGHESLGEVIEAPASGELQPGDRIAGIVRRPDPEPCSSCAAGEWDMCRNGRYRERGIKELDGFAAEEVRLESAFAVKVDPALGRAGVLLEPASVVAKAWDHVERIGRRSRTWEPRRALVTGAGPVGLLAALMSVQRGLETHVFDRVSEGPKPQLVRDLGATYHGGESAGIAAIAPDVVIECTGAGAVVLDVIEHGAAGAIVCLAGLSSGRHKVALDLSLLNRSLVLENEVVFGTVNANRSHYEAAAAALARAPRAWLLRIVSRRVPLARWAEAFDRRPDDVKVVIDFTA